MYHLIALDVLINFGFYLKRSTDVNYLSGNNIREYSNFSKCYAPPKSAV